MKQCPRPFKAGQSDRRRKLPEHRRPRPLPEDQGTMGRVLQHGRRISRPVNGMTFQSSEGLYQALKFPHDTTAQRAIAQASNGYRSKNGIRGEQAHARVGRRQDRRHAGGPGLQAGPARFGAMLISSAGRTIVENSSRDPFWGARPVNGGYQGSILGRLLNELRYGKPQPAAGGRRQWNSWPAPWARNS